MVTRLTGSSWGHTRGHDPMVAASQLYARDHDVEIEWTPRTLTEFGVLDIGALARQYDLVVIDHPHVGGVAASGSLVPLDEVLGAGRLDGLADGSPGRSHQSYHYQDHQWALAIDAACQVSAHRDDAPSDMPQTWDDVEQLARDGRVVWPINPVDVQASFLTIAAQLGTPIDGTGDEFIPAEVGEVVLERMHAVAKHLDPACFEMNAIDALESLASSESPAFYCPLVFGYTNYSRAGYRDALLRFGDIPTIRAGAAPAGSLLGGVGLGVSAQSESVDEAAEFALWLAGPEVQAGVFVEAGGQPAHRAAWENPRVDDLVGGFFSGVRRTTDLSWMRPRIPGYVDWQNASLSVIHDALRRGAGFDAAVRELNRLAPPASV